MKKITALSVLIFTALFARAAVLAQETVDSDTRKSVKAKITVSRQSIDQQMTAYKGELKEIVNDAEKSFKKIDDESKLI